jgi:hypothetical protein
VGSIALSRSVGPYLERGARELEDLSERLKDGMTREQEDVVVVQHGVTRFERLGL